MTETTTPKLTMGRNKLGEDVIIWAEFPGGHIVDWDRDIKVGPQPRRKRGVRTAATGQAHAEALAEWARGLIAASEWAIANADKLRGIDG